jgi:glutathione S-transferase
LNQADQHPLVLHYNRLSPYCQKLRFFLEEAGIPYRLQDVDFKTFDAQDPEFLRISPAGMIPVIETPWGAVADSTVAMRYLADRMQRHEFFPINLEDRAGVDFWLEYVNQHVGRYLMRLSWYTYWQGRQGGPGRPMQAGYDRLIDDCMTAIHKYMPALARQLAGGTFLCGPRLTLADVNLAPYLFQGRLAALDFTSWPAVSAWQQRIEQRSTWRKVFESAIK